MQSPQSPKKARAPPRSRKSIAHMPSPDVNTDKENVTIDSTAALSSVVQANSTSRRLRSKSIGPGGLEALKEDTGNRGQSAVAPFVKSILKPTMRLSPPKQIPPRPGSGRTSPKRPNSRTSTEKPQLSTSPDATMWKNSNPVSGSNGLPNPFGGPTDSISSQSNIGSPSQSQTRVAVRTEAEQQAAAKERERQEALAHKDARRKSLANRRVSFAPEATLHTWDVVEVPEDSTTSSADNSTRRASGLSAVVASPYPQPRSPTPSADASDASKPPSTPAEQVDEVQVAVSPAHQRDLHQKKRRRSSVIPPMNFNNPDDFSSSPGSINSDDTGSQASVRAEEEVESSDSDDDVMDESTVTRLDGDDITPQSNQDSSSGSNGKLEEALRQAAKQAGTQGIDYDEHGDITMELADDEVTAAFKPWIRKGKYFPKVMGGPSALQDQENTNPFSPAFKAEFTENARKDDAEKTMEFTQAVGAILPHREDVQASPKNDRRRSATRSERRSSGASHRLSGDSSLISDKTMDLTTAIGGIQQNLPTTEQVQDLKDTESIDEDEELTMEFTSVVGGVLQRGNEDQDRNSSHADDHLVNQQQHRGGNFPESEEFSYNEEDMDITMAAGGILPSITERTEPEDQTMEMDITTAIGAILPEQLRTGNKAEAKLLMEREADSSQPAGSPFFASVLADSRSLSHTAIVASETGSPSLASSQRRPNPRVNAAGRQSVTPKFELHYPTPSKKPTTPSKQSTPKPTRPTTPGKTPPSKNVSLRTGSPKKLFKAEVKKLGPAPHLLASNPLFRSNADSTEATPIIILKPRHRRSSGLGIDKEGLGSPRVTALLDRRRSIGEDAEAFKPQDQGLRGVRFDDPQVMEQELEKQRAEDERRESGRGILQMEVESKDLDEQKDVTTNLKDLIQSLTPRKKKLNGRKSLHVGAAKGLLGKRPAELDEDDEDEDLTPKRLKGREGSPVKKVRLPAPPPKIETTGRVTRSGRLSLTETAGNKNVGTPSKGTSPMKNSRVTTPKDQSRFKDTELQSGGGNAALSFNQQLYAGSVEAIMPREEDDRIHLQDFLNMTSIQFIELTTTKRRLTVAPNGILENKAKNSGVGTGFASSVEKGSELESCVVAGACTVPMLELYQHSCRELKKYIAEGRSIIREIEVDTFEENPPLFREYISAPPEIKPIMDNQFKNVKTHARLLSKAMWVEWRMKLLDGLKDGLLRVGEGMDEDDELLTQQKRLLESALPGLIQERDHLEVDRQILQARADELASWDQEELQDARDSLVAVENDLQTKEKIFEDVQSDSRRKDEGIEIALERERQCLEEIQEAEKILKDSQEWSPSGVATLQISVDALEQAHGWTIVSVAGASLTMSYKRTLQLFFTPASFMPTTVSASRPNKPENSSISLTYIADAHEYHPQALTTEKRFFLQIMRAQLQCLLQCQTKIKDLLGLVSGNWEKACAIFEEARILNMSYITEPTIQSDDVMTVRSVLLLRDMKTKLDIGFEVTVQSQESTVELDVAVRPSAKVVYGESRKEKKMVEFLEQRISGKSGTGAWAMAVEELEKKLIAQGRK